MNKMYEIIALIIILFFAICFIALGVKCSNLEEKINELENKNELIVEALQEQQTINRNLLKMIDLVK